MQRTRKVRILLDILLYDQWQYAIARSRSRKVRFVLSKFLSVYQISGCMADHRSEKLEMVREECVRQRSEGAIKLGIIFFSLFL